MEKTNKVSIQSIMFIISEELSDIYSDLDNRARIEGDTIDLSFIEIERKVARLRELIDLKSK